MAEKIVSQRAKKIKDKDDATEKGRSLVGMILDKSGSMEQIRADTIGSVNAYLKDLFDSGEDHRITMFLFDTHVTTYCQNTPVGDVERLNNTNYAPSGSTALNDAIMSCCRSIENAANQDDVVTIVIVTDGEENASKEYRSKATVLQKIEAYQARGWNFLYLSASPSAFIDGASYGIYAGTMSYTHNAAGIQAAVSSASRSTTANYNSGGGVEGRKIVAETLYAAAQASPNLDYQAQATAKNDTDNDQDC